MSTLDTGDSPNPTPFNANNPAPVSTGRTITYWALALALVAELTVIAAALAGDTKPTAAWTALAGITACSTVLIAAEQIATRTRRRQGTTPTDAKNSASDTRVMVLSSTRRGSPAAAKASGRDAAEGGGDDQPLGNSRILLPLPVDDGKERR